MPDNPSSSAQPKAPAFILGSPRSGTTILGKVLDQHPLLSVWYEPYYLWERHFDVVADDIYADATVSDRVRNDLRTEYERYRVLTKAGSVVDKLPTHAFNMPVLLDIFPHAKFIHLLRDGRDVTFSIHREWLKRESIVKDKSVQGVLNLAKNMLTRQPFWRYRLMALKHELGQMSFSNPGSLYNKSRWQGYAGWGPRFKGWKQCLDSGSILAFNAHQWAHSVTSVQADWDLIPKENRVVIRYEDLIARQDEVLSQITEFLGYPSSPSYLQSLPRLMADNTQKWRQRFDQEQIEDIKPVLTPLLRELGYLDKWPWVLDD